MCTLIALHRCVPGAPLVVAANRDEYLDRPSEAPAIRPMGYGVVLAPLDVRAGGTWLGLNPHGVFAALTNRRCSQPDPERRSRGLLVTDMLAASSAAEAARMLAELPERAYNPFNFFVADGSDAFVTSYVDTPVVGEVPPGAHVLGNVDPEDRNDPKLARVRERAEKAAGVSRARVIDELADVCREHDSGAGPLSDTCVHFDGYGTRSSALLMLADREDESRLFFADGPPCRTEYTNSTSLLRALSRQASDVSGESSAGTKH